MQGRAISGATLPNRFARADDFYRMTARKLVYRLMVFAPAIFLVGIGVHARGISTSYDTLANDHRTEQNILAYIPVLQASEPYASSFAKAPIERTKQIARRWIGDAEKGILNPLVPVAYEDTSSEGVKSQIFEAKGRIVRALLRDIEPSMKSGRTEDAAESAVLALKLSNVLKYSDFVSMFNCAAEQRRVMREIEPLVTKLDAKNQAAISEAIATLKLDTKRVSTLVRRTKKLFMDWRTRHGSEPLSIEDTQLLSEIPILVRDDTAIAMQRFRERMLASRDSSIPSYCSSVRLGIASHELLAKDAAKVRRLMKAGGPRR